MPEILTTNAQIKCPHGGKGSIVLARERKFTIADGDVCLTGDTGTIAGCALLSYPCASFTLQSLNLNATEVDGKAIILHSDFQKTSTGFPLIILPETMIGIDDSILAGIPAGQSAAPLSAAMADETAPTVLGIAPLNSFTLSSFMPASLSMTFTLTSQFPSSWMLNFIDSKTGRTLELHKTVVPGIVVSPNDGVWRQSPLTISVNLSAAFLSTLLPATDHQLVMIAINERGLSGFEIISLQIIP